jgi:mycothiol synthase
MLCDTLKMALLVLIHGGRPMRAHQSRSFAGDADLGRMEALVIEACAHFGPNFECAMGDLGWRLHRASTVCPEANIRLWEDESRVLVGFAWFIPNGDIDLVVYPRDWCAEIVPEMLEWAEERFQMPGATDRPDRTLVAWSLASNTPLTDELRRAGLVPNGHAYLHLWCSLASTLSPVALTPGYSIRSVFGLAEAAARAALRRAAFPHSHMTTESYSRLMATCHYRPKLDMVAVTPQGEFAAMALAWFDAHNKTGELEPVGTHPAHRTRRLASAASEEAMRRLHEHGAHAVIVYAEAENFASVEMYRRLAFTVVDTNHGFVRPT